MSYKVTSPLVVVPNADAASGDGYFYKDAVIPDGFNDERCKQLVKDGMLEKVKPEKSADADSGSAAKEPTVPEILEGVGDDKEKAAAALEQEKAGKNRKTLVDPLEAILAKD